MNSDDQHQLLPVYNFWLASFKNEINIMLLNIENLQKSNFELASFIEGVTGTSHQLAEIFSQEYAANIIQKNKQFLSRVRVLKKVYRKKLFVKKLLVNEQANNLMSIWCSLDRLHSSIDKFHILHELKKNTGEMPDAESELFYNSFKEKGLLEELDCLYVFFNEVLTKLEQRLLEANDGNVKAHFELGWSADVVDLMTLIDAVAQGKAPLDCIQINSSFLDKEASNKKQEGELFKGVRCVKTISIVDQSEYAL